MEIRLNSTALVPPQPKDGFKYRDGSPARQLHHWWVYWDATDAWIFGGSYQDLVEHLREHLVTNRLPVPADLDGTIQEIICAMAPRNWKNGCIVRDDSGFSLTVAIDHVRRWAKTMAAYAMDAELVSQEVAERRARTCLACHYRVPITGCKGCGASLGSLVTRLITKRSTSVDEHLTACGVCGCAQRAMVHFPNRTLDQGSAGLQYPSDTGPRDAEGNAVPCWRLEKE